MEVRPSELVARQGAAREAERLLSEARPVDQTECLNRRAKVRMDLAEVFQLAGREKDRAIAGHGAIDLYHRRATERRRSRRRSCSLSHRRVVEGPIEGPPPDPDPPCGPPPSASASSGKAAATSASVQSSTNSRVRSVISATSFPRTILSLSRARTTKSPQQGLFVCFEGGHLTASRAATVARHREQRERCREDDRRDHHRCHDERAAWWCARSGACLPPFRQSADGPQEDR